ncbi:MAG: cell division protein ZapB [Acidobacteriota bacterium]|uniref:cell division protein ZapB n=1 Tax=Fundidesulfovibrio agrisoli TaxID=2922717 RepID=UPI001FADF9C8|nr:cell division protein ZapB [Fundidesulfovibrio agrisoli]
MDIIDTLEERIAQLVSRLKALEEENRELKAAMERDNASMKEALDQERQKKDAVLSRVDQLLRKLQEEPI